MKKTKTIDELKEYIRKGIELEKIIYTQETVLYSLMDRVDSLGKAQKFDIKAERHVEGKGSGFAIIFVGALALAISIFLFIGGASCSCDGLYVVGAFPLIIAIIFLVLGISVSRDLKREKQLAHTEYIDQLGDAWVARENDKIRVENEERIKDNLFEQFNILHEKHKESLKIRDEFYSVDIIFPKYRNIIALCSFYEYLISGRCEMLEGPNGAYNIFENELRLDMIVIKLDEVVAHLDQIERNQYMLHSAIVECSGKVDTLIRNTEAIASTLDYIADNSDIVAQNSKWAAEELTTIKWLQYFK